MRSLNQHLLAGVVLLTVLCARVGLAQAGNSGFSILKLGVSARGVAMADAMNGHASGVAATFYNPAGLSLPLEDSSTAQLTITHREWIQDTRTEFIGGLLHISDRDAIGFSMNSTTVSDIEIRTRPGAAEATFTARNYWVGVSYGRQISDELRIGATVKFLYEKILVDEASGIGLDIGGLYDTPLDHLSIGATISNLGSMNTLRNENTKLPALVRFGPAYKAVLDDINSLATIASDIVHVLPDGKSYLNAGGELLFDRTFAVRVGYRFGSEGQKFSAGIGVLYEFLTLDYAYAPLALDLGNTHTISLSFNL